MICMLSMLSIMDPCGSAFSWGVWTLLGSQMGARLPSILSSIKEWKWGITAWVRNGTGWGQGGRGSQTPRLPVTEWSWDNGALWASEESRDWGKRISGITLRVSVWVQRAQGFSVGNLGSTVWCDKCFTPQQFLMTETVSACPSHLFNVCHGK